MGRATATGLQVLFPSNCVSVLSGPLTWAASSALPSPTPIPSLVWACFLWRGPLTAFSLLGLNCVQRWGRGEGTDCGPCVSVRTCVCVCARTSLGAGVLERGSGGLLVSLKAFDNKERFLFSVETKPSLPEADRCPLLLSFSPRTFPVPLSSSPSVSFSLFSFCIILYSPPSFRLQVTFSVFWPVSHSYFCLSPSLFPPRPSTFLPFLSLLSSPTPQTHSSSRVWSCHTTDFHTSRKTHGRFFLGSSLNSQIPWGTERQHDVDRPSPLLATSPRDGASGPAVGSALGAFAYLFLFLADKFLPRTAPSQAGWDLLFAARGAGSRAMCCSTNKLMYLQ